MKINDLTGKKFGKLTVICQSEDDKRGQKYWLCKCDCGNEKIIAGRHMTSNKTLSCGCDSRMFGKTNPFYKHGESKSRLYNIWCGMKDRCFNSNSTFFDRYGGRGITICTKWKNDFLEFKGWATLNGYQQELTIERVNNDGNYEPHNCIWATKKEQGNNRCSTTKIKYNGLILSLTEHCERMKVNYNSVKTRLSRGWIFDDAVKGKHVHHPEMQDIPARKIVSEGE